MTNKFLLLCMISLGVWSALFIAGRKTNDISYELFKTSKGWGYNILVDEKTFIHQETIPAMSDNKGFEKKEEAKMAAHLIITKLKERKLPTLSKFEIGQILRTKYKARGKM